MIPFNKACFTGKETQYVNDAMTLPKLSGDGFYAKKCQEWFEKKLNAKKALLTPSCTQALEMAAILLDIKPGDEVIMPSFTFVSTANAFVLRGARIVFIDIDPDTMNLDCDLIEAAITERTRVIVPVHYAGVSCDMDKVMNIAEKYSLFVVEDAAQGMSAKYKGKELGSIGHMGAYSFHDTKNFTSGGEGGLLIINDANFSERAEIIREKGTNRSQLFRGMVDKYGWVDLGSSYLPSELQAAYLWGQIQEIAEIQKNRMNTWNFYYQHLRELEVRGKITLPKVSDGCEQNAHMFYLKVSGLQERTKLIDFLKNNGVSAAFHYIPLHSSVAGQKFSKFSGEDRFTTVESERLVRLPLWYGMNMNELIRVVDVVNKFWSAGC